MAGAESKRCPALASLLLAVAMVLVISPDAAAAGGRPIDPSSATHIELPDWQELPTELRQQMTAFRLEMHRWHEDPSQRFVLINGRRIEEDGVVGQELWVREIRAEGVVMQFRNLRFFKSR
jgi:general secretion pathway protein B